MTGPINNADNHTHEHPTPRSVIEAAHKTMGGIDLDPATTEEFNQIVCAKNFFTRTDNGLAQDWTPHQRIFLNPPGSQTPKGQPKAPSCHEWLDYLVASLGPSHQAVFIGYNGPETLSRRPQHCRAADGAIWTSVEGTAALEEGFIKASGRVQFAGDRPYFPSIILILRETPIHSEAWWGRDRSATAKEQ